MREIVSLYALNRGVVSRLGLARTDVKRLALAAQVQTNWMPKVLGSMSLRPGLGYIGATYTNLATRYLKFIFATTDTALVELTASIMRVWINDVVLTRPTVATTIVNGTFPTNLASWTNYDDAGAVSSWAAAGSMKLLGTGTARAIREQAVVCSTPNVEHGIRIGITTGPVTLRIGSTSGGDEYVTETTLYAGYHSISIVPTGDFYIRFSSLKSYGVYVNNCTIEAAGVVTLPTPWGASDLGNVRYDQSGDVLFVGCSGIQQRRIERRGARPNARSWSVALYAPEDGPFNVENATPLTITPSAITGDITLTASLPLFKSTHVGGLFAITSVGQLVTKTASASATATNSVRIVGIGASRIFYVAHTGDASGSTVDLQRSYDNATWTNVAGQSWTVDNASNYLDGLDNQIVYYRLILTTRVAPDTVVMQVAFGAGSIRGVARVTSYTSSTLVNAQVVSDLGGVTASRTWQEGKWSTLKGWPTSLALHDGRLWWSGINGVWGSASDAYDSFDETIVGDSGPINRTIGAGPVDTVSWMLSLKGLCFGAQGSEYTVRASSLDEVLTPTNFNIKASSNQGSGAVQAIKVDQSGYFVNRSSAKVYDLSFDVRAYDYAASDLMLLAPEIARVGIVRMDYQRQPDTRIHCVLADGTAVVAVVNKLEEVLALIPIETDGLIEDVVVLPASTGNTDDQVYYVVNRTINGATVRYLEKWAQEVDCRGGSLNKIADAYVTYTGSAITVITGLSHLEGEQVVVWADGADVGTDDSTTTWTQLYTVSGGQITLATAASNVVVGLGYTAQFQSAKLGSAEQGRTANNRQKKIGHIGLMLADMHPRGLRYGPDFDNLDDMPLIEDGTTIGTGTQADYDQNLIEFPGTWTTDLRVCLQAVAPRPVTVLAVTLDLVANS